MSLYKTEQSSKYLISKIYQWLYQEPHVIEQFNQRFGSNLKTREIVLVKAQPSANGRNITIKYYICNENKFCAKFFQVVAGNLIKKMKKWMKKTRFPFIVFAEDKDYVKRINSIIKEDVDPSIEQQEQKKIENIKQEKKEEINSV